MHLNGGDAALHALLGRIYDLLAPGGRLILEPQPWNSYQAAVHKPVCAQSLFILHCVALWLLALTPTYRERQACPVLRLRVVQCDVQQQLRVSQQPAWSPFSESCLS